MIKRVELEEFGCLEVKLDKKDWQEKDIKYGINKARAVTAMLNGVEWNSQIIRS